MPLAEPKARLANGKPDEEPPTVHSRGEAANQELTDEAARSANNQLANERCVANPEPKCQNRGDGRSTEDGMRQNLALTTQTTDDDQCVNCIEDGLPRRCAASGVDRACAA